MSPGSPLLIALPDGLNVSGVTAWAVRLANGLVERSRAAALLLHAEPPGQSPVHFDIDGRVRILRPKDIGRFGDAGADGLTVAIAAYRDAIRSLACDFGGPVVVSPNLHGDCYGVAAALALVDPALVRLVGWQHSDNEYDARVLAHYEPALTKLVAVSDRIESVLRARLPSRTNDITNLPYGIEVEASITSSREPGSLRTRSAATGPHPPTPLRLIYSGRLEHRQKRILALPALSDALTARGLSHTITVAGDGPSAADLDAAIGSRPIRRLGALDPDAVRDLLGQHDIFVLPSRFEGLSVAMLEAMASGCVPVVARTESGALQAIERGYNGEIADVGPEADERTTGTALAEAVARALKRGLAPMADAAAQTIRERFSLDRHLARAEALIDAAAASPPRTWPADRPCAFSSSSSFLCGAGVPPALSSSGSLPPDGPERMRAALHRLAGRTIVIHGAGEHSRQLGPVFAASPARIAAFTDDDRARHGQTLWNWPIIPPSEAATTGATDVVISSWMHEQAILSRRALYERQNLRVTAIYQQK